MKLHKDQKILKNILNKYINKNENILDVGCGVGRNLKLLRSLNYKKIYGTDISVDMINISKKEGLNVFLPEDIRSNQKQFDVLIFSHVLEHVNEDCIQKFLEEYFRLLKDNGKIIILTPVLYDAFFNDIDHVKPCYPNGLIRLFSDEFVSKKYKSSFNLLLEDIYFRKSSLLPYNLRSRYIKKIRYKIMFAFLEYLFLALQILSLGVLSKTTGYGAYFLLKKK